MLRFAAVGKAATAVTLRPLFANDSEARYGAYLEDLVASPAVKSAVSSLAEQVSDFAARRMVRETIRQALDSLHDDLDTPIDAITGLVESAGWAASARRPVEALYDPGAILCLTAAPIHPTTDTQIDIPP